MARDSYETWLRALRQRLATAVVEAEPLVAEGRCDDAEALVRRVDGDIYGAVALGDLLTRALQQQVIRLDPDRAAAEALFERALRKRSDWSEPHTREEAESDRTHAAAFGTELRSLLGSLHED